MAINLVQKNLLSLVFLLMCGQSGFSQIVYEYQIITSVESIVPAGAGRSRLISQNEPVNYLDFTTSRTDGKKSDQGDIKRGDLKIENFEETKLLNFYSIAGINFQNIASNDAVLSDKLTQMSAQGWELQFVVSGVESDAGASDGVGIFITRYTFRRVK